MGSFCSCGPRVVCRSCGVAEVQDVAVGAFDFDECMGMEMRALRDYGRPAAVLRCGDRDHVAQCAFAATDRLPLFSQMLRELLINKEAPRSVVAETKRDVEEAEEDVAAWAASVPP